jgi:hypothetical protein
MHVLLRYLRRAGYFPEEGRPTDGQLLERFATQREEAASAGYRLPSCNL